MSLAMPTSSLASSSLQGSSTGAVKPRRPYRTSSVGTTTSSSLTYVSSSRAPRVLPHGPGPLPNRPYVVDKSGPRAGTIKYVAATKTSASSSRIAPASHFSHQSSYGVYSPTAQRKTSHDSVYGSSSRNGYTYGDLRSGKSKSLSQLNPHRDETSDFSRSPANRSRMESSVHGFSSRTGHTYTQNHVGTKGTLNGGSNTKSSSTSMYRSTTHLDYKDPKEDRKSQHNLYSSHKDLSLSNGHTTLGKDNNSVRDVKDVDKTRKPTITALPGSDMKCTRKSSFSSSNSSTSNSVSICCRKLIIWFISSSLAALV